MVEADRSPDGLASHSEETLLRTLLAFTATLFTLSTLIVASPANAITAPAYEGQTVNATNNYRTANDLHQLQADDCLTRFANRQAARMAAEQRIFHQDLSPVLQRCNLSQVGENVAYGYPSGRVLVNEGWMQSPGHRANILTRQFRIVAVGAARSETGRWYAAQVLGRR